MIYMDYQATTPVDPRVLEAMLPFFGARFGNPASRTHAFGWEAEEAVEDARTRIAGAVGADPEEIVFTSGATEANNLAIKGVAEACLDRGNQIVTVQTEHHSVLDPCRALERRGFRVTYLPVRPDGIVDLDLLRAAVTEGTALVSVMAANNEVGVLQPIQEVARIAKERGALFHCDATQAAGKEPLDVKAFGIDLLSLSAHKAYGPKGVGALVVRRSRPRVRLLPLLDGGGHERGLRSGTLNVPGIVGFARAIEICLAEMTSEKSRLAGLRDRLRAGVQEDLPEVTLNGHPTLRLAGNLNLSFAGVDGEALLTGLKDVAVSSGSACTSSSLEPSYVLRAMGVQDALAKSSIRFGLGRFTTPEEVDTVVEQVTAHVRRLRAISPHYEEALP